MTLIKQITPECQPTFPCWLWFPPQQCWFFHPDNEGCERLTSGWWHPNWPTPPTEVPEAARTPVEAAFDSMVAQRAAAPQATGGTPDRAEVIARELMCWSVVPTFEGVSNHKVHSCLREAAGLLRDLATLRDDLEKAKAELAHRESAAKIEQHQRVLTGVYVTNLESQLTAANAQIAEAKQELDNRNAMIRSKCREIDAIVKETDAVSTALRQQLALAREDGERLAKAIDSIASQKTSDEWGDEKNDCDFETGHDTCVKVARAARGNGGDAK